MAPRMLVSIEGGIAAGKSTLLARLKETLGNKCGIVFLDEPVDMWVKMGFLEDLYTGACSAAAFQIMVLDVLARQTKQVLLEWPIEQPLLLITERSVFSNRETFARSNLNEADMRIYDFLWTHAVGELPLVDVRFIYLKLPFDQAMQRVAARNRAGEAAIAPEYMQKLARMHDDWLGSKPGVVSIDASQSATAVFEDALTAVLGFGAAMLR